MNERGLVFCRCQAPGAKSTAKKNVRNYLLSQKGAAIIGNGSRSVQSATEVWTLVDDPRGNPGGLKPRGEMALRLATITARTAYKGGSVLPGKEG